MQVCVSVIIAVCICTSCHLSDLMCVSKSKLLLLTWNLRGTRYNLTLLTLVLEHYTRYTLTLVMTGAGTLHTIHFNSGDDWCRNITHDTL